ncbi:MAG: hypothetical protein K2X75_06165 [Burkholderiaceae bacterium]|jgi:hypothetical protein|nr:hypothetical protein [Burkholderiaceae bacterium]
MANNNRIEATLPGEGGTPVRTEFLADGVRRHTLADGRIFEEDGPKFRLEYQSVFPGETYSRDIAIFGLAEPKHLFEAWCYVYNALRTYAFSKVVSLEEVATGKCYSGEELRELLGGESLYDLD